MLDGGPIQPSQSLWCNAVILVHKKDGGLWFCIDFHRLNHQAKKDAFPLLRMQETMESMVGAQLFMQGLFACVGSGDPDRVLRLFHNNYTGYCCIHLLCIATYNLSLPRLSANYYGLPTTVQLRAARQIRCSRVGVSRSTAVRYCTVPA